MPSERNVIAFEGLNLIAAGSVSEVARKTKRVLERGERGPVLIFDDQTSELVEIDFRGPLREVLKRLAEPDTKRANQAEEPAEHPPRGPGRPKLGVVAREVTLLPRHWDWLGAQPGGASVALRKLVEHARRTHEGADRTRRSQEVCYRFLHALAGNLPGFEEATRALFAADGDRFDSLVAEWPEGVRDHAKRLAERAFAQK